MQAVCDRLVIARIGWDSINTDGDRMESAHMERLYIERWKLLLANHERPWVLFTHGTCVILMEPESDVSKQATEIIAQWPVQAGTDRGDFDVIYPDDAPGWVITCGHPDILTYLAPEEVQDEGVPDVALGLQGRAKRDQDAHERHIIFVKSADGVA